MSTRQTCFGKTSLIEEAKKKLGLVIKDNAITTNKIKDSAVTESKIADDAVTTSKIKDYSVTGNKIMPGSITTDKYSPTSIITGAIVDGAITEEKIRDNAVTTNKIKEGSININQLSNKCISDIQTSSMGEEAIKSFINDELSKKQGEIIEVNVRKTDDNGDLVEDDLDNPKITSFDYDKIYEKFKSGLPITILYKYSKIDDMDFSIPKIESLPVYNMDCYTLSHFGPNHKHITTFYYSVYASNDVRNITLKREENNEKDTGWKLTVADKTPLLYEYVTK